ncbi:MAG: hypothetical protein R3F56_18690 [Planctomycetota bacterium]
MANNVRDLKEALTARSQTATLEELQSRGRRSVRVIRADDVAQMIEASVSQAIARSGMMSPQEVEELEAKSREQFQLLLERRQAEIAELRQAADELRGAQEALGAAEAERDQAVGGLEKVRGHVDELLGRIDDLETQRDEAVQRLRKSEVEREELASALQGLDGQRSQARHEATMAQAEVAKMRAERDEAVAHAHVLEQQLAKAQRESSTTVAGGVNADMVYRLMSEIAELRARTAAAPAPQQNDKATADALAGALQQLTSTFTAKLDSLGRKMGVSSAVEADAPSLTGLFKHQDGVKLESNMDNVSVKAKTGTGIAANLERLKKLKGGG